MLKFKERLSYLFSSTKGLALVGIAVLSLVTAIWGMLSGPMVEWGVRDILVQITGMDLIQAEREGRVIMLYHTIAMTVVAIEVYFITGMVKIKKHEQTIINATITVGYLLAIVFGLIFAYFGHFSGQRERSVVHTGECDPELSGHGCQRLGG